MKIINTCKYVNLKKIMITINWRLTKYNNNELKKFLNQFARKKSSMWLRWGKKILKIKEIHTHNLYNSWTHTKYYTFLYYKYVKTFIYFCRFSMKNKNQKYFKFLVLFFLFLYWYILKGILKINKNYSNEKKPQKYQWIIAKVRPKIDIKF